MGGFFLVDFRNFGYDILPVTQADSSIEQFYDGNGFRMPISLSVGAFMSEDIVVLSKPDEGSTSLIILTFDGMQRPNVILFACYCWN